MNMNDFAAQHEYAKIYNKDHIKYIKLANRIKDIIMHYIDEESGLLEYKLKNIWIYVVSCRFNPKNTAINIHIGTNGDADEILKFFNTHKKQIRFYCAKALEKTHNMPDMNFHSNTIIDEILEWDKMKQLQE